MMIVFYSLLKRRWSERSIYIFTFTVLKVTVTLAGSSWRHGTLTLDPALLCSKQDFHRSSPLVWFGRTGWTWRAAMPVQTSSQPGCTSPCPSAPWQREEHQVAKSRFGVTFIFGGTLGSRCCCRFSRCAWFTRERWLCLDMTMGSQPPPDALAEAAGPEAPQCCGWTLPSQSSPVQNCPALLPL